MTARLLVALAILLWWVPRVAHADEADGFGFTVVRHGLPPRLCTAEKITVEVELRNDGQVPWTDALGDRFAYHWLDESGAVVVREGRRTAIRGLVLPGRSTTVRARVDAPADPGRHTLVWAMVRDKVRWYPDPPGEGAVLRPAIDIVAGQTPLGFSIAVDGSPTIVAGETTSVPVRLRNEGCGAWSSAFGDALAYHWYDEDGREVVHEGMRTPLPAVAPGAAIELDARVEGPPGPGRHLLVFEPVREPLAWFGAPSSGAAAVAVEVAPPSLAWSLRAADMPTVSHAGASVRVRVAVRNDGTETWRDDTGDRLSYRITPADPRAPAIEGVRTPWPHEVEPGETIALDAVLELPTRPGRYTVRWRPVREHVRWYGPGTDDPDDRRDAFVIDVGPPQLAWSIVEVEPTPRMLASRTSLVRVVVRNDGGDTWSPTTGDRVSYRWYDDHGAALGGEGMRSELPHDVAPGEQVALEVRVRAPDATGPAMLELGMVREHVAWFPPPAQAATATQRVLVIRWGLLLTAAALGALGVLGILGRATRSARLHGLAREFWAPAHAAVATLGLGEIFSDLARIEAWTGTAAIAASASAWFAVAVALVPLRWRRATTVVLIVVAFALALVDLGYLDFFGSIVPLSAVTAIHHLGDAHATVFSLWHPDYLQLTWPLLTLVSLVALAPEAVLPRPTTGARTLVIVVALGCAVPSLRGLVALADSPIGARVFSERDNVGRLGLWNAHIFEGARQIRRWLGVDRLSDEQRREVMSFFAARSAARPPPVVPPESPNVVVIQIEAMQSWVVDAQVGGEAVMPFLAAAEHDAIHYTHVFDQTAQGRTSDAEYLVLQSGHPLRTGALAFLRADNAFDTIAHRFAAAGYDTLSAHPYARGFWNRAVIHPRYGFGSSLFREEIGDGPAVGWGLDDVEFLGRMATVLATRPRPFFGFFITLSLHHPYSEFPKHLVELELGALEGTSVGNYLHGMRRADRALAGFFAALDTVGLAENTVVLVYGDHVTGLPWSAELDALAGAPRWDPTVPTRSHRVPAFVWLPDRSRTGRDDRIAGQIDLGPTMLDLAGLDVPAAFVGHSLLREASDAIVALPDGSAFAADRFWIARGRDSISGGGCFDPSGRARDRADCQALARQAADELWASRAVLDHDLYRAMLQ